MPSEAGQQTDTQTPSPDDCIGGSEEELSELLQQFCEGSEEAALKIVQRFTPHVRRTVRAKLPRSIRSKVDSTDLVNTLLGALLLKRTYLADLNDPDRILALLTKAARERVVDEYRKYVGGARNISREVRFDDGDNAKGNQAGRPIMASDRRLGERTSTPSSIVAARENWERVLSSLDDRDREIVQLRKKGFTSQEIAEQLTSVSDRTVRRVLNKVMEQLLHQCNQ